MEVSLKKAGTIGIVHRSMLSSVIWTVQDSTSNDIYICKVCIMFMQQLFQEIRISVNPLLVHCQEEVSNQGAFVSLSIMI